MIRIRIALAAALLIGATSVAMADCWDFNLANRYPGFAGASVQSLQTRNVALTGQAAVKTIDRAGANHDSR